MVFREFASMNIYSIVMLNDSKLEEFEEIIKSVLMLCVDIEEM